MPYDHLKNGLPSRRAPKDDDFPPHVGDGQAGEDPSVSSDEDEKLTSGNATVDRVFALRAQGAQFGKIYNSWATEMRDERGRVDTDAIYLLSVLIEFYEPTVTYDEGRPEAISTWLEDDHLQIRRKVLASMLGVSEATAKRRLAALEDHGVIRRHVTRSRTEDAGEVRSQLQIELCMERVEEITYPARIDATTGEVVRADRRLGRSDRRVKSAPTGGIKSDPSTKTLPTKPLATKRASGRGRSTRSNGRPAAASRAVSVKDETDGRVGLPSDDRPARPPALSKSSAADGDVNGEAGQGRFQPGLPTPGTASSSRDRRPPSSPSTFSHAQQPRRRGAAECRRDQPASVRTGHQRHARPRREHASSSAPTKRGQSPQNDLDELTQLHERAIEQDEQLERQARLGARATLGFFDRLLDRAEAEEDERERTRARRRAQTTVLAQTLERTVGVSGSKAYGAGGHIASSLLRYDPEATRSLIPILFAAAARGQGSLTAMDDLALAHARALGHTPGMRYNAPGRIELYSAIADELGVRT